MSDLDDVADDLYAGPPADFVARRTAAVKAARADGDKELAAAIGDLRKPTVSAWLVNLLVRDDPALAQQVIALGEGLREAEKSLDGPALRELSAQRRQLVRSLVARARRLAQAAGQKVGEQVAQELDATLTAALADPEVAREVASGRLTAAREYAGFGSGDASASAGPRTPSAPSRPPTPTPRRLTVVGGSGRSRDTRPPTAEQPTRTRPTSPGSPPPSGTGASAARPGSSARARRRRPRGTPPTAQRPRPDDATTRPSPPATTAPPRSPARSRPRRAPTTRRTTWCASWPRCGAGSPRPARRPPRRTGTSAWRSRPCGTTSAR